MASVIAESPFAAYPSSGSAGILDVPQPGHPVGQFPHRTRTRRVARPSISLARKRLEAGQALVEPEGDLSEKYRIAKRVFDVVGTMGLLILLAPIMLAIFLILLVTTRGKPLFWQYRAGYCGRPIRVFKFRTMVLDAASRKHEVVNEQDGPVFKNRHDPRITCIGRLLRKTSLDETPQLFSVLLGHMSLVGPRPLVLEEVAQFKAWQRRRLSVKPGLTCLWQISGRSEIGFEDWMRLDIWYVRNQSFWTDLKLLLLTPTAVLAGRGAY